MNRKHAPLFDCAYGLELADGTFWKLTGDQKVSGWLGELADIMGLGPVSRKPTHIIHFHGVKHLASAFHPGPRFITCGENGWKPFKNGGIHRVWRHIDLTEVHVELQEAFLDHEEIRYINMRTALRELHRHVLSNGGTPMHATLAALEGEGVLIAGDGGTGKSTCYARLPDYWERLCDDQALILRINDGSFWVHPCPTWSEHFFRKSKKQWQVERSVPLKAVFFLEQSARDETILLSDPPQVFPEYFSAAKQVWQLLWSKVEKEDKSVQCAMLLDNVTRMARVIPAYRLRASLEGKFWEEIEKIWF